VADSLHGHGEKQAGTRYAVFYQMKELFLSYSETDKDRID
jgi:hypothetical protein